MNKQLIGVLRIVAFLIIMYGLGINFSSFDLKFWASDLIHGAHTPELRNTTSVWFLVLLILVPSCFYIFQTIVYIFVGGALEGKRTGIFRFFGFVISGLREAANDKYFWTSDSDSSSFNNIDKVLSYRDNKMALMSNREAADYMAGTGHVDFLLSRPDLKQSRKALSYMNNKIALMDNAAALKFIKGQK